MKKLFKAFSLVEMLITLAILSVVMLITTLTLNTIVKTSAIAKYKTVTRHEVDFAIELIDRLLSNSNVADVYVFDSSEVRYYDVQENQIRDNTESFSEEQIALKYDEELATGDEGNEIHVRPYGYPIWVCIGYFKDNNIEDPRGYLVKRTMTNLTDENHASCFDQGVEPTQPLLVLTSEEVSVTDFNVSYIKSASNNNVFYVDIMMEPIYWVGSSDKIQKEVFRQAVITTKGLTWY